MTTAMLKALNDNIAEMKKDGTIVKISGEIRPDRRQHDSIRQSCGIPDERGSFDGIPRIAMPHVKISDFFLYLPTLLAGAKLTILLSLATFCVAIVIALLVALGRLSRFRLLRIP